MPLLLVGTNHTVAPLAIRERLALTAEQGEHLLDSLLNYVPHAVVLATCNRTEVYVTAHNTSLGAQHVHRFLSEWTGLTLADLRPHLYAMEGWDPLRHLFKVASGLDSMIVGEEQILGQVRAAADLARARDALDAVLAAAFTQAVRTGRKVRTETKISRKAVSVSSAAIDLAQQRLGGLAGKHALVVAAGEAGELAAKALAGRRLAGLRISSRTLENAQALAARLHATAVPWDDLVRAVAQADLVVTSTGAPGVIHTYDMVRQAMAGRQRRPLVILDIAVPRDVEPAVATLPGVTLYNIEDVQQFAEANLHLRRQEIEAAEAIVAADVAAFQAWWQTQQVVPTVRQLQRKAEAIRKQELERTLRRLNLAERDQEAVAAMTRAIVKKLLHDPLVYLKARRSGEEALDVVRALFGLADEPAPAPQPDGAPAPRP